MIDTKRMREVVQDGNYKNVWLNGSTHYDECVYSHYPCAVLELCDELDALRARVAELEESNRQLIIALTDVMTWVDGWEPTFTEDPEWVETNAAVWQALGGKP